MSRQAEEVWKGPWKCEECGEILNHFSHKHMWGGTPYGYCSGKLVPHDRRNPTQAAALIQAKREGEAEREKLIEILEGLMDGLDDYWITLPEGRHAVKQARAVLEEVGNRGEE